jgi:putative peptide zinc metalloprotease protein
MATDAGMVLTGSDARLSGSQSGQDPVQPLPSLRQDVDLHPAARLVDGSPSWVLQDRARNRFFRIGWVEFEILRRWQLQLPQRIVDEVNRDTAARITPEDVDDMRQFLAASGLLLLTGAQGKGAWRAALSGRKTHWAKWLLQNYLFLRIHLIRPDALLRFLLPLVRPLMTRVALIWTMLFALLGVVLVLRQWDVFIASAPQFMTADGLVLYGAAIVIAKILHELGHGLAAARHGLRVPSMGIALMVLWPVLYSDTTEAWKLTERRSRLQIAAAGMAAELMLAVFALNLWLLLPPGQLRGAVFALAAVTWIATLAVNLNPFMRFDGYYLLSDSLDVENLQDRSFTLARWRLRRVLFGFDEPCPEVLPIRTGHLLVFYAWGTWIYRLFLFIGIAVLVYFMVFKALGIFLMVAEIGFFIVLPIIREGRVWWQRRALFRFNINLVLTLAVLGGLGLAVAVPWKTTIQAPALLLAGQEHAIYPPFGARLERVAAVEGDKVSAGTSLFLLSAPDIALAQLQAERRIVTLRLQIQRERGENQLRERGGILREQLAEALAERDGHARELSRLNIPAVYDGIVADVAIGMAAGRWVAKDDRLALLISSKPAMIEAYLDAGDLGRVSVGVKGKFYTEGEIGDPIPVTVRTIDTAATSRLARPYLASRYGGDLEVRADGTGALQPELPIYRMMLEPEQTVAPPRHIRRGWVILEGPAKRLFDRAWRTVAAVIIRESGF